MHEWFDFADDFLLGYKQSFWNNKYLADLKSSREFLDHHILRTTRYVIARIHTRICGCNYRHLMAPISKVSSWIPNREAKRTLLNMAKYNRVGPLPLAEDSEKPRYQHAGRCIWVQLTYSSNKNCPIYATQKSYNLDKQAIYEYIFHIHRS
jgi:hypothetical protein